MQGILQIREEKQLFESRCDRLLGVYTDIIDLCGLHFIQDFLHREKRLPHISHCAWYVDACFGINREDLDNRQSMGVSDH